MKLKYRYYLKDDNELKILDSEILPAEFDKKDRPRLTLAMLSAGVEGNMVEKARDFFIDQGFVIRMPIFTDESGVKYEGRNNEYRFRGEKFYYFAMRPSQGAQVLIDAIEDGFDIHTTGGLGFAQNNRFFFEGLKKNPEKFIGKQKPRIFGFSNISNAIMLQDFFDYVHCPAFFQFPRILKTMPEAAQQTLSIIKGLDVDLARQAVAVNDLACDLVDKAKQDGAKIRTYPINMWTFFLNQYNSDFAFTPPKEDYSLMVEAIVWHDAKETANSLAEFERFLRRIKNNGQKLPLMIEVGNFSSVETSNGDLKFEYGRVGGGELSEEKRLDSLQKSKAYDEEIKKICDNFKIAFFVGGEKRIGHSLDNQVQPSNSVCEVSEGGDAISFNIKSGVNCRSKITKDDFGMVTMKEKMPKLSKDTAVIAAKKDYQIKLKLEQVNENFSGALDLSDVKSANFAFTRAASADLHDDLEDKELQCFVVSRMFLMGVFMKVLEPMLLSGKIYHDDKLPIAIVLSGSEPDEDLLQKAKKMIRDFCREHQVNKPICLAKDFLGLMRDPNLKESLMEGGVVNYQVEIAMDRGAKKDPSDGFEVVSGSGFAKGGLSI